MLMTPSRRLTIATLLGALSTTAGAAGFQLLEQSATGLGNAYAGTAAVAENASTVHYNPAGMTELQGRQISVGLNYIDLNATYESGNQINPGGAGSAAFFSRKLATGSAEGGDAKPVPNLYLTLPITKDLVFGLGTNAVYGMRTDWSSGWAGQYHGEVTDVKTINVNPSLAWKVNDAFSVGFGLNYQKIDALLNQSINGGNHAACGGACPDGLFQVSGNSYKWGYNFGLLFKPVEGTKIGVAYRSAISHKLEGRYSVQGLSPVSLGVYRSLGKFASTSGDASVEIKLPDVLTVSLAHQVNDRWEALADISRTGWSKIPELRIKDASNGSTVGLSTYDWKNTWRVSLGTNYKVNDQWKAKFGIAFDQGVTDDAHRTPRLPDSNRVWLSVGGQYKVSSTSALDFGYAYVQAKEASSSLGSDSPTATGAINGTYKSHVQILGVQYSQQF